MITLTQLLGRKGRAHSVSDSTTVDPAALVLVAVCAGALAASGLVGLALFVLAPDTIQGWVLPMQQNLPEPFFSLQEIAAVQARAAVAATVYFIMAAGVAIYGPRFAAAALRDFGALARRWRRVSWAHLAAVVCLTAAAAALVVSHISQPMRTDEAASFLHYGTRPVVVALGFYESTGNHILYSVLMSLMAAFSTAEWAVRLPAAVAAVGTVPLLYLAGRRQFGVTAGLLAAALAAGSVFTTNLATDARGYALVVFCFVAVLALLPDVIQRRPAAWAGFVLLSALGAWAVPVMIYPFALTVIWLLVEGTRRAPASGRWLWLRDVSIAAAATGVLVALLYSPALVVTGFSDQGTVRMLQIGRSLDTAERLLEIAANIGEAWRQWTYPAPPWASALIAALTGVGWIAALVHGGRSAALAVAAVVGPAAVLVATQLSQPPPRTLSFGFPVVVLFTAYPIAPAVDRFAAGVRTLWNAVEPSTVTAGGTLAAVALAGLVSPYPDYFPGYHGYKDAREAAAYLHAQGLDEAWVVVTPYRLDSPDHLASPLKPPLNYYLYRLGHGDHTVSRNLAAPPAPRWLFHVGAGPIGPIPKELHATTSSRFCLRETKRLDESWIRAYEVAIPAVPSARCREATSATTLTLESRG